MHGVLCWAANNVAKFHVSIFAKIFVLFSNQSRFRNVCA
jgi:hypothetical protein